MSSFMKLGCGHILTPTQFSYAYSHNRCPVGNCHKIITRQAIVTQEAYRRNDQVESKSQEWGRSERKEAEPAAIARRAEGKIQWILTSVLKDGALLFSSLSNELPFRNFSIEGLQQQGKKEILFLITEAMQDAMTRWLRDNRIEQNPRFETEQPGFLLYPCDAEPNLSRLVALLKQGMVEEDQSKVDRLLGLPTSSGRLPPPPLSSRPDQGVCFLRNEEMDPLMLFFYSVSLDFPFRDFALLKVEYNEDFSLMIDLSTKQKKQMTQWLKDKGLDENPKYLVLNVREDKRSYVCTRKKNPQIFMPLLEILKRHVHPADRVAIENFVSTSADFVSEEYRIENEKYLHFVKVRGNWLFQVFDIREGTKEASPAIALGVEPKQVAAMTDWLKEIGLDAAPRFEKSQTNPSDPYLWYVCDEEASGFALLRDILTVNLSEEDRKKVEELFATSEIDEFLSDPQQAVELR